MSVLLASRCHAYRVNGIVKQKVLSSLTATTGQVSTKTSGDQSVRLSRIHIMNAETLFLPPAQPTLPRIPTGDSKYMGRKGNTSMLANYTVIIRRVFTTAESY